MRLRRISYGNNACWSVDFFFFIIGQNDGWSFCRSASGADRNQTIAINYYYSEIILMDTP